VEHLAHASSEIANGRDFLNRRKLQFLPRKGPRQRVDVFSERHPKLPGFEISI